MNCRVCSGWGMQRNDKGQYVRCDRCDAAGTEPKDRNLFRIGLILLIVFWTAIFAYFVL